MKRRDFGLLAGTSFATAAAFRRPAHAQPAGADPMLLTTTLTPMGAERAGNADGSIPAWTGGLTAPPLPPDQPIQVQLFTGEQPLYEVNAANMTQYAHLLSPGTEAQITKFGLRLKVFQTHRTASAPQFVYENTAKNVTRAKLDPRGGRLGFTGAVGGVPFPIINTSDPLVGGAELIWNHLTVWDGSSTMVTFNPGCVMIGGKLILVAATQTRAVSPYYDPEVTPETFDGYFSKLHAYYKAPGSVVGQEVLVWHTTNVNVNPDIVWTLLNGQGRVRKAPNQQFDSPNPGSNGIASLDESNGFYGNPSQYDWTYIGKQEMLIPYNNNGTKSHSVQELLGPHFLNSDIVRWEKHRVWIVEGNLHPGIHNVNARRRYYIDEDTWLIMLGEGYDGNGVMWKAYLNLNECIPSLPGTVEQATIIFNLLTSDYVYNGNNNLAPYTASMYALPQEASLFEPQQMAAQASF